MERLRIREPEVRLRPGRKTILNDRLIKEFCDLVKKGLPADGVCDYLGINETTYWSWIRRGQKYLDGDGEPKEDAIYGKFVAEFRRATACYRLERIESLHRPGNDLWTREMAILERRDRKSFSKYDIAGGTDEDIDPDEKFY